MFKMSYFSNMIKKSLGYLIQKLDKCLHYIFYNLEQRN